MTSLPLPWHQRLVRLGRRRAQFFITLFSVIASLGFTVLSYWIFDGQPADIPAYFLPALLIPAAVAPLASRWIIDAAIALDTAHTRSAEHAGQLAAVLGTAPVGIAHVAPDLRLRSANAPARALLGPDRNDQVNWDALFVGAEERRDLVQAIESGTALRNARWRWHGNDGLTRLVRGHVAPLADDRGAHGGSVFIFEDITELAALEAQVVRMQHLDLAGRLAGGMAHDFNNLLTIIRASVESLQRSAETPPSELHAIEDAAQRGARLTRRLLAISRRDIHIPVSQSVGPLLRETVDLMRRVVPPGIQMTVASELPTVPVMIDHDAVQQALINLIINAQDALGTGGTIRLTAQERCEGDGVDWLVLGVHDDGPGMTAAVLVRATEPFFSTKPAHLGTGLGLSIVTDTMQRHGGRLQLESSEGRGTDASLWLPVTTAAAAVAPVSTPAATDAAGAPPHPSLHLLLVEDETDVRVATERALRRLGYQVTSLESVSEALIWLARNQTPDLIISDVMMPGATGLDLVHAMRTHGRLIPVLLVSGFAAEEVDHELASSERVAFLAKPWTLGELQKSIQSLLPGAAREGVS